MTSKHVWSEWEQFEQLIVDAAISHTINGPSAVNFCQQAIQTSSWPVFGFKISQKTGSGVTFQLPYIFQSKSYPPPEKNHFDENVAKNLSADVEY